LEPRARGRPRRSSAAAGFFLSVEQRRQLKVEQARAAEEEAAQAAVQRAEQELLQRERNQVAILHKFQEEKRQSAQDNAALSTGRKVHPFLMKKPAPALPVAEAPPAEEVRIPPPASRPVRGQGRVKLRLQ
jgi:hypothetical protein